jgi:hypothetical protein
MVLLPRICWDNYQKPQTVKDLTEGENDYCAEFRRNQMRPRKVVGIHKDMVQI